MSNLLEDIGKSPYLDSLSVINTMTASNINLFEMIQNGKVFGLPAQWYIKLLEKFRDKNGLNQQDRYVILHNTIKTVLNMVPTDFQDFTIDVEDLDIL